MATNGESAKRWLMQHHGTVSIERIQQIRDFILTKLQRLDDTDPAVQGLLGAIDVLDNHLSEKHLTEKEPSHKTALSTLDPKIDSSPLIRESQYDIPQLSYEEKQRRFQALLAQGRI